MSARAGAEGGLVGVLLEIIAVRHGAGPAAAAELALATVAVAVASTVGHEFGHAVLARRNGLAVVAFRIESLLGGGLERETSDRPDVDQRICLAGPAVTLLLAAVGAAAASCGALYPGMVLATVNAVALIGCVLPWSRSDVARALHARSAARTLRSPVVASDMPTSRPMGITVDPALVAETGRHATA